MKNKFLIFPDDLFYSELWLSDKFTIPQAYIDLYHLARYNDGMSIHRGQVFKIKRGQLFSTTTFLGERWQVHRATVCKYLSILKDLGMIDYKSTKDGQIITILDYMYSSSSKILKRADDKSDENA